MFNTCSFSVTLATLATLCTPALTLFNFDYALRLRQPLYVVVCVSLHHSLSHPSLSIYFYTDIIHTLFLCFVPFIVEHSIGVSTSAYGVCVWCTLCACSRSVGDVCIILYGRVYIWALLFSCALSKFVSTLLFVNKYYYSTIVKKCMYSWYSNASGFSVQFIIARWSKHKQRECVCARLSWNVEDIENHTN